MAKTISFQQRLDAEIERALDAELERITNLFVGELKRLNARKRALRTGPKAGTTPDRRAIAHIHEHNRVQG